MVNYTCPKCENTMVRNTSTIFRSNSYICFKCGIGFVEPGHYFNEFWTMWINYIDLDDESNKMWIDEKSFEDCVRKWKLKALW